jgi:hypothetical protein
VRELAAEIALLTERSTYRVVRTSGIGQLPSMVSSFFTKHKALFESAPGLWLKGGAARIPFLSWVLSTTYDYHPAVRDPRDIDAVVFGQYDYELAAKLTELVGRRGFEFMTSMDVYFASRDVGINEVAIRPDKLAFSHKAFRDATRMELHTSANEVDNGEIPSRVAIRAATFAIESHFTIPERVLDALGKASDFDLLLGLFKSSATGNEEALLDAYQSKAGHRFKDADDAIVALVAGIAFTVRPENAARYKQAKSARSES